MRASLEPDRYVLPLSDLLRRPSWQRDALCREHPGLPWVPTRPDVSPALAERLASVCRRCLVRAECAAYADELAADPAALGFYAGRSLAARRRSRTEVDAA